jgi:hypothetical protein
MTSRSGVRAPGCKIVTITFSKSANEHASVVAAYLRVSGAAATIQIRSYLFAPAFRDKLNQSQDHVPAAASTPVVFSLPLPRAAQG